MGPLASVTSQFYTHILLVYDNNTELEDVKKLIDLFVDIIYKGSTKIIELYKMDNDFEPLFKKIIFVLDQATQVIVSFTIIQKSTFDHVKMVTKQFVLAENLKDKIGKCKTDIFQAISILTFKVALSSFPTNVPSTVTPNPVLTLQSNEIKEENNNKETLTLTLREILHNPLTDFTADIQIHIKRMKEPCRLWLYELVKIWLQDPHASRLFFIQGAAGIFEK